MLPSDALVIKQVLESMVPVAVEGSLAVCGSHTAAAMPEICCGLQGIKEYEPRVVHQLLDFMYRNVAEVLQVAEVSTPMTTRAT